MFPEERKRRIIERVRSGAAVTVQDLAQVFGVSESTIRRDLRELEREGLLERTHGGAVPADPTLTEPSYAEKSDQNRAEKMAIARVAAGMVHDGASIILDAGTTTLEIARLLKDRRNLTVVTNAYPIAAELADAPGVEVIVTGGTVRGKTLALVGPLAEQVLEQVNADLVFLGTNGIDIERGLTTPTPAEASVKRRMIAAARKVVVVADSSKAWRVAFAAVAPVSSMHMLISDRGLDPRLAHELLARGIQVLTAE
ncbi:DeoR/GlpR family DNA-binding transcription regulator [Symbiobacterium thermophilum]|uniref:DeoR family transcriptional regulator n=1 Tax=Symbiobacterium thermophilum TaxID=2734 RepID=A0A953I716_SYMTR|nr:DeoR/GlpR family DNA-binding transcription regulator [Symbiobacterium thermophilum]MBY6275638.1 DeoR family transcriptional regulator [Symbiobacterium thermophilum]